jgi:predicted RND superfamily exporter protein
MQMRVAALYDRAILGSPVTTLLVIGLITAVAAWYAQDFSLDATTESLTLQNDEDLDYYRSIRARYGSDDFLIVTVTPHNDLFSQAVLQSLGEIKHALARLPGVDSVTSILDVPLLQSPPVQLQNLATGVRRLEDPGTDSTLARRELLASPLYERLLISSDARTTAMRVDLVQDTEYLRLRDARDVLREKALAAPLSGSEKSALEAAEDLFRQYAESALRREQEQIAAVREVLEEHADIGSIHLGGVPMIVADSMDFIRHDLIVFGTAVIIFLVVILTAAFRKPRWVILPLVTCLTSCLLMLGLLGFMNWHVTVVSSNFVSLLLILCLALTLHIIVRYREIHAAAPDAEQSALVRETVRRVFVPCLYTALTTMVAFGSLIVSDIGPIVDFGWMMVIGVAVAFVLSFSLFPAALLLLPAGEAASRKDLTARITAFFAHIVIEHSKTTIVVFLLVALFSIAGTTRLTVENRFIDYYHDSTEIYRGMLIIDRELGGTTPLDVIVDAPAVDEPDEQYDPEFDDIYADDPDSEAGITASSYWYNRSQLRNVIAIHDYLDELPETGKVISIATAARILEQVEPGILDDNIELSLVHKRVPEDVKAALFDPYLSPDGDQLRFSVRVFESDPTLRRAALIARIRQHLVEESRLDEGQVHLTGMLLLYNNMLESLFRSQILTLGAVFVAIMFMFLVLFRSLRIAVIAIIPNALSAGIVLGIMGWAGISLDLMTITIAAITIGIGVDDTIHYVHRFEYEFSRDRDYMAAISRCHATIGRAMYYTSVTVMLGFSILVLSRFVPTIYFGLLTGLAMLIALFSNMTLLPVLIETFHVHGPGRKAGPAAPAQGNNA